VEIPFVATTGGGSEQTMPKIDVWGQQKENCDSSMPDRSRIERAIIELVRIAARVGLVRLIALGPIAVAVLSARHAKAPQDPKALVFSSEMGNCT
jgi:hypothetical protein